jgi:hypothetical protein
LELEEARFGKTIKGGPTVFDKEGYRYLKNKTQITYGTVKVWWRCDDKKKSGCSGICVTEGLFIKSIKGTHNHKPGEPEYKPKIRIESFESLEIK